MSTIFISNPLPNGHSTTITSKFGHILNSAELKYGERDKSYTLLGIEFTSDVLPRIWYPGNCKNVIIQITMNCLNDINRAVYQVAHETIHCLSPTGGRNGNFLEEGLAVHFSIEYTRNNGNGIWLSGIPKYDVALRLIEQLFIIDQDIIKKLRQKEPIFSLMTKELLIMTNKNIPENLADNLTKKFY